jgi:hypothetical protein
MEETRAEKRVAVSVRLDKNEHELLKMRVKETGFSTINGYIRKIALNGYIINFDTTAILEPTRLIRNISSSINQIAARVNSINSIYADDIDELKSQYDKLLQNISVITDYMRKLED